MLMKDLTVMHMYKAVKCPQGNVNPERLQLAKQYLYPLRGHAAMKVAFSFHLDCTCKFPVIHKSIEKGVQ